MSEEMAGYNSAHQQGYDKGYEAGVKDGLSVMKKRIIYLIESLHFKVTKDNSENNEE